MCVDPEGTEEQLCNRGFAHVQGKSFFDIVHEDISCIHGHVYPLVSEDATTLPAWFAPWPKNNNDNNYNTLTTTAITSNTRGSAGTSLPLQPYLHAQLGATHGAHSFVGEEG
jgi:hypothetical protein